MLGRAGRGDKKGRVLIQTTDPSNYLLESVINHSYLDFYEKEIEHRKNFNYPPFFDIILFEINGRYLEDIKKEAAKLYDILVKENQGLYKVFSPKSPYIQKLNNKYRINIILKTKISKTFYEVMYKNLNIYNKARKKDINVQITVNPTFMG